MRSLPDPFTFFLQMELIHVGDDKGSAPSPSFPVIWLRLLVFMAAGYDFLPAKVDQVGWWPLGNCLAVSN
ncbi:hypothetical protein MLD38_011601 [Melastoma candidum]|uniref:Uncharacterized protein n=1 Tax=Melastoma candidum TaxID=119954 RepID=A0ACB9R3L9_9MYRT|nr:hypothetical protein MLD38_011601 [Melastoma candidum]